MALPTARVLTIADAVVTRINADLVSYSLTGSAVRGYSFGFTDAELASLRLVVRPMDLDREYQDKTSEDRKYSIQIGIMKMLSKSNVANIDLYLNMAARIAILFPLNYDLSLGGGVSVEVVGNRFVPLYFQTTETMDSQDASVRFDSRLLLEFRELGRATSEVT